MKTVKARLSIEIYVDCPKCGDSIDILYSEDTSKKDHNEECILLDQALDFGGDSHLNFTCENVKCTVCNEVFNVKELEW